MDFGPVLDWRIGIVRSAGQDIVTPAHCFNGARIGNEYSMRRTGVHTAVDYR